jgi:putative ABC transport system permease protein
MSDQHSNQQSESRWLRFLRSFCPPDLYEGIEGDLLEQFESDVASLGPKKAGWKFKRNVLRFFRPGIVMRNTFQNRLRNAGMLRNYFTIAYRNIVRNPGYTALNVVGLTLGLASCFIIGLYVKHEISFETFHENREHIYRYIPRYTKDGQMTMQVQTAPGMAPFIRDEVPEILEAVRYTEWDDLPQLEWKEQLLPQATVSIADSGFFKIFSFKLTAGDKDEVLKRPLSMLVSRSIAERTFGQENPIGQVISYDRNLQFEVTGVFEDIPANSHLQFDYLFSMASLPRLYNQGPEALTSMYNWSFSTYLYAPFGEKVQEAMAIKMKEVGFDEAAGHHWLQPLTEIHFTQGIRGDGPTSDIGLIYIFSAIAVFVILIACFNFMNLSTARAIRRSKEVGIRKTMGAFRTQLVLQFLTESFLIVMAAGIAGLAVLWLAVPLFNEKMALELTLASLADTSFLWQLGLIILATVIVAGSYPAFYLSSFTPSGALRAGRAAGGAPSFFRNALTVAQFSIAAFLMTATLVVISQTVYMKATDPGFDKDQVVYFYLPPDMRGSNFGVLKQRLLSNTAISDVSKSSDIPGNITGHFIYEMPEGDAKRTEAFTTVAVDYDFLNVLGIELADGRNFSGEYATDFNQAYVVNEALVRFLELDKRPGGAVGASFRLVSDNYPDGKIVGVVKDFHARSLKESIEPMVMWLSDAGWEQYGMVKLSGGRSGLTLLDDEWQALANGYPLTYHFLDDHLESMYRNEERSVLLIGSFSALAIFISCLGLIGLVSFLAEQKKKEIGIRKVLGASVNGIVGLLSWKFVRLVLVAVAIATPVSLLAMRKWLANFAFTITLQWWHFTLPVMVVLLITFLVSGSFTVSAARANPVDSLKYE